MKYRQTLLCWTIMGPLLTYLDLNTRTRPAFPVEREQRCAAKDVFSDYFPSPSSAFVWTSEMNGFGLQACAPGPNSPVKLAGFFPHTKPLNLDPTPPPPFWQMGPEIQVSLSPTLWAAHKTPWCKDTETRCSCSSWDSRVLSGGIPYQLFWVHRCLRHLIPSDRRECCGLDHKYIAWHFLFLQLLQFPEGMTLHHRPASSAVESQLWK